jgi:hypothetical protein
LDSQYAWLRWYDADATVSVPLSNCFFAALLSMKTRLKHEGRHLSLGLRRLLA